MPIALYRPHPETGERLPVWLDTADVPVVLAGYTRLFHRHGYVGAMFRPSEAEMLAMGFPSNSAQVLARYLLGLHRGDPREVDHKDRNPLNNRRSNLRLVTPGENKLNRGMTSRNRSGYKGVTWRTNRQSWAAQVQFRDATGKRRIVSRSFLTREEAAAWWDEKAREIHGPLVLTNKDLGLLD